MSGYGHYCKHTRKKKKNIKQKVQKTTGNPSPVRIMGVFLRRKRLLRYLWQSGQQKRKAGTSFTDSKPKYYTKPMGPSNNP